MPPDHCPAPTDDPRFRPLAGDPRFAWGLHLPRGRPPEEVLGLLVAVHDSTRDAASYLDGFADWADAHGHAVLAPWFPTDPLGDGNEHGYKFIDEGPLRYDHLLHAMAEAAAHAAGVPSERFRQILLYGYSGGAQFAHRYLWLHPQRVRAACIGAPGEVTLPDWHEDWWAGLRDSGTRFGRPADPPAAARVPLLLLVGERDTDTDEMREQPRSAFWPSDEARLSSNRQTRLALLHQALLGLGSQAELEQLPGVAHGNGAEPARTRAAAWFSACLGRAAAQPSSADAKAK